MSGGARFHLGSSPTSREQMQLPGRKSEDALSHTGCSLSAPSCITVSSLPCREKKVCGRLQVLQKGPVRGGRCRAVASRSLTPRMARKRGGRQGEPGSSDLPGHPSGRGPATGAVSGLLGELILGAGVADWDPLASKTRWGRAGAVPAVSGARRAARPGALSPLSPACTLSSPQSCRESKKMSLRSVGGVEVGDSSWSDRFLAPKWQVPHLLLSAGGAATHWRVGRGSKAWSPYKIFCCPNRSFLLPTTP